jgi:type IV pilus assembly protein PilA
VTEAKMKAKDSNGSRGFTLIELLVVVAIIGILVAIAIPQFALYRQQAFDAAAKSDLRNYANGEEAYFAEHGAYVSCVSPCLVLPTKVGMSTGVTVTMIAQNQSFTGTSKHVVSSKTFMWDSAAGGLQP